MVRSVRVVWGSRDEVVTGGWLGEDGYGRMVGESG